MSTTTLLLIIAVVVIVIALILLLLRRRKAKGQPEKSAPPPAAQAAVKQTAEAPPAPPKFIVDPPEVAAADKALLPDLPTLPAEEPLTSAENEEEKIRILVVDDNRDTADNVSRLLYFEDDLEVIGQAYGGQDGVRMAVEKKPHIVLMDINMPDIDGIVATKQMSQDVPYSQVIIMSVQADAQYMRQAMSAGARDYQTKPFSADELVNTIRRVYRRALPTYQKLEATKTARPQLAEHPSKKEATPIQNTPVITLYSPKGGSGVSTIAANLAIALQKEQGDVVLVDADLQFGDLNVHLNTQVDRSMGDLADIDALDADLIAQVLQPHKSGLNLLLAPQKPELSDFITPDKLTQIIGFLQDQHQAVIIDTSTFLSNQTLTILDAAVYFLLVIAPEIPALKNAKLFLELIEKLEYSSERIGIVVNRANIAEGISAEQIKKVLKLQNMYYVPNDVKLYFATNKGQSIFEYEDNASSAQAITLLAEMVWKRMNNSREG